MSRGTLVQAPFKALGTSRGAPRCWELSKIVRVRPFGQCQSAGILVSNVGISKAAYPHCSERLPQPLQSSKCRKNCPEMARSEPSRTARGLMPPACLQSSCFPWCCRVLPWLSRGCDVGHPRTRGQLLCLIADAPSCPPLCPYGKLR